MATTDKTSSSGDEFGDPQWVVFGGQPSPEPGRAPEHGAFDAFRKLFARDIEEVQDDFRRVAGQLQTIVQAIPRVAGEYEVDEFSIELGFSASGKLVFVAEAGLETTVSITFRKKSESG